MSNESENKRIDLTQLEWMISDYRKKAEEKTGRTLLDLDAIAMVPELIAELKRCYEKIDAVDQLVCLLDELLDTDNMTFSKREEIGDPSHLWGALTSYFFEG